MLLFCAFVEAGHHIAPLFTNMTLPLPLLRVRYHPQSNDLSVTLLMHFFLYSLYLDKLKKKLLHMYGTLAWLHTLSGINLCLSTLVCIPADPDKRFVDTYDKYNIDIDVY